MLLKSVTISCMCLLQTAITAKIFRRGSGYVKKKNNYLLERKTNMSSISQGMAAIYNPGMIPMQGSGRLSDRIKATNKFAKKHKLASQGIDLASNLGYAPSGTAGRLTREVKHRGYGKKKKRKSKK
eukprot:Lithocolla_globosa_v1_NODE_286_length_4646_cov_126.764975.p6 type:complete len:126 gc:universal NODE_286_length_4646_cov_126.764975:641-264(-)